MREIKLKSAAEQVADGLEKSIEEGDLYGALPGVKELASRVGVSHRTVEAALSLLERDGLVINKGNGRRREVAKEKKLTRTGLRIALFPHEPLAMTAGYIVELQQLLRNRGYRAFFADRCLLELKGDPARVARLVKRTIADAWVVIGGSQEILTWFIEKEIKTFALFGRRRNLPVPGAGPDKAKAYREIVRRLVDLGHRKIVLLVQKERRLPRPGAVEQAFLDELAACGLPTGSYNLPHWEAGPGGLKAVLQSMFQITPPTAIICDEAYLFHGVMHQLSHQGHRVPDDVSLICTDPDRTFELCNPSIAHVRWDPAPVLRRVVSWADHLAKEQPDFRQIVTDARFIEGGTVGSVSASRMKS